jgi:glycosyltransferase involved in cell wall biosynthesis
MNIAFLDVGDCDYTPDSAYHQPLGGTASAVCYLTEELAKLGHEVTLLNRTTTPGRWRNVLCLPFTAVTPEVRRSFAVLVVVNLAGESQALRRVLSDQTRLVLWVHHAPDQPAMQGLRYAFERSSYDGLAFVSQWQQQQFVQQFGIDPTRSRVLRNAISPAFGKRSQPDAAILTQKAQPPILAYTSTPFRGLAQLLDVFPKIRAAVPGVRLQVFSSMQVYNRPDDEYESLYQRCRSTAGVEYLGSVPQPLLATELAAVQVLAYPNTFPETACIAVMEAMASGCWIVTSDWGALPETTAGFARLIPVTGDWEAYLEQFAAEVIAVLTMSPGAAEPHLREQAAYATSTYTWVTRAQEWVNWLSELLEQPIAQSGAPLTAAAIAQEYLQAGDYSEAAALLEPLLRREPTNLSHYWYLGLALLLQHQDAEAQAVWSLALLENQPDSLKDALAELRQILETEQQRQQQAGDRSRVQKLQTAISQL